MDNEAALAWFNTVANTAIRNQELCESDYRNPADGLMYCGRCHTPREARIEVFGEKRLLPIVCKCRSDEANAAKRRRQEGEDRDFISALRERSMMGKKLSSQTFSAFEETAQNKRILRLCKRYADGFEEMYAHNQGLLLYGDVGTGKTFCAACIANALLDRKISVLMTSFAKILEDFSSNESNAMQQMNQARLLILDDLGAERGSDFALERVYDVVDSRYRSSQPMILTTNLDLEEMKQTTDIRRSRIYDRIFEVCYPVKFTGKSLRKAEANRRFTEMREFLKGDTQ